MIVEHSFVTVLEPSRAFDLIEGFLGAYGFSRLGQPGAVQRDFSRGRKDNLRAAYLRDIPQKIRVEYDRGRINFAASINFKGKEYSQLRDFTVALAVGLDRLLEDRLDVSIAHALVEAPAEKVAKRDTVHKVIRITAVTALILLISLPVIIGVIASANSR